MKMHICIYFYEKIPLRGLPQTLPESSAVWHDHFFLIFFKKIPVRGPPQTLPESSAVWREDGRGRGEPQWFVTFFILFYFL